MIDNSSNAGMFSTTLQNMIIDAPLNLILGTLKEYLDDPKNYTLMGIHNDYLQSALMNIDTSMMQYDLTGNPDLKGDFDNLIALAYDLVKKAFCKEFGLDVTDFDETFRTMESNRYAMETIYEIFYNRRMTLIHNFLEQQIFSNFDSIVKRYKSLIDVKDVCYQGLKNSVSLPNKDYYVFIISIKDVMKDILGSPDQYKPLNVFMACSDIAEEQLETLTCLLGDDNTFLSTLFESVVSSDNYHSLEVSLKNSLLTLTQNNAQEFLANNP